LNHFHFIGQTFRLGHGQFKQRVAPGCVRLAVFDGGPAIRPEQDSPGRRQLLEELPVELRWDREHDRAGPLEIDHGFDHRKRRLYVLDLNQAQRAASHRVRIGDEFSDESFELLGRRGCQHCRLPGPYRRDLDQDRHTGNGAGLLPVCPHRLHRGSLDRPGGGTDRGHDDASGRAHFGLADTVELIASASATEASGEGGFTRTRRLSPTLVIEVLDLAQPGSALRTAGSIG
jgi:hypothetical protein